MLAVGRQVATALVDPALEPLPHLEGISASIPEQGGDLLARASANHQPKWGVSCQQYVQSGGEIGHGYAICASFWFYCAALQVREPQRFPAVTRGA